MHELAFCIVICFAWRQDVPWAAASEGGPLFRYFWKENFAKFARKPLKILPVAWPCQCVKQPEHQHLLLKGLHPSRAGHRRWFSGGLQVGEHSGRRGSWMPAWPRRVPVASRLRLSLRGLRTPADDTLRTFANGRVAQHPVDPLGIGVGVPRLLLGRATGNQEAARASVVPA